MPTLPQYAKTRRSKQQMAHGIMKTVAFTGLSQLCKAPTSTSTLVPLPLAHLSHRCCKQHLALFSLAASFRMFSLESCFSLGYRASVLNSQSNTATISAARP
jgi:hypothetical protein